MFLEIVSDYFKNQTPEVPEIVLNDVLQKPDARGPRDSFELLQKQDKGSQDSFNLLQKPGTSVP